MTIFTLKNDPSVKVDMLRSPYTDEEEYVRVVRQNRKEAIYQLIEADKCIYVRMGKKTMSVMGQKLNWEEKVIPLNWTFV